MEERWHKSVFERFLFETVENEIMDTQWRGQILYSLKAGGKRFRPALSFYCGESLGVNPKKLFIIGSAIELLHTASLIHDDLPEIDDDDYRRGKLAHHKKFDHGTAVIAGDYLFFFAFDLITRLNDLELTQYFLKCSRDLAYGEYLDIILEDQKVIKEKDIHRMYLLKTARLIEFSMTAPSILTKKTDKHVQLLKTASQKIGIAFQILDDLKGIEGSFEEIGKTPGKDALNNKKTVPTLLGIEASKKLVDQKRVECLSDLRAIKTLDGTDYEGVIEYLLAIWKKIVIA